MEVERREATAGTQASAPGHRSTAEPSTAAPAAGTPTNATGFKFAALGQELVVAGVFVRVYNEQPNFPVADPAAFCKGLVTFIHGHMKPEVTLVPHRPPPPPQPTRLPCLVSHSESACRVPCLIPCLCAIPWYTGVQPYGALHSHVHHPTAHSLKTHHLCHMDPRASVLLTETALCCGVKAGWCIMCLIIKMHPLGLVVTGAA